MNKLIDKSVKERFKTRFDDNDKILRNVANYGLNAGDKAVLLRNGEYYNVEIEALERIPKLYTSEIIKKAYKHFCESDIPYVIGLLEIREEFAKYGEDCIHYLFFTWFSKNDIAVPSIIKNDVKLNDSKFLEKILMTVEKPLAGRLMVTGIGKALPESWLGMIFENGAAMHQAMNSLDNRIGKPPVTYCVIYSMMIVGSELWKNVNDVVIKKNSLIMYISDIGNGLESYIAYDNRFDDDVRNKNGDENMVHVGAGFYIVVNKNIFDNNPVYKDSVKISLLSSSLQKSLRRGNLQLLDETIQLFKMASYYNLPEQHFVKVSSSRQLCWRSFITMIEDVCGYILSGDSSKLVSIMDLVILALICNIDPSKKLSPNVFNYIGMTLNRACCVGGLWNWRKYDEFDESRIELDYKINSINDPLVIAYNYMPKMAGDARLILKCLTMVGDKKYKPVILDKVCGECVGLDYMMCKMASYDMHCLPNIIILLQAEIPFIGERELYTTKYLSSYIWEFSSKINYREKHKSDLTENTDVTECLHSVQKYLIDGLVGSELFVISEKLNDVVMDDNIDVNVARLGFLLIFGKKFKLAYKNKNNVALDVIISGNVGDEFKIKKQTSTKAMEYLTGEEKEAGIERFLEHMKNGENITMPEPPVGYRWSGGLIVGKKYEIKIIDRQFYIGKIVVEAFNAFNILNKLDDIIENKMVDSKLNKLIDEVLYIRNPRKNICAYMHKLYNNFKNNVELFEWIRDCKISNDIWLKVYTKIMMSDNVIIVGGIDRTGNKTHTSIDYIYEGVIFRLLSLLMILYPKVLAPYELMSMKFKLNINGYGYTNMMRMLEKLTIVKNKIVYGDEIYIKNQLWSHQQSSVNKIFNMLTINGKKGSGDASHVGAGKTLTALALMSKLYNHNLECGIFTHGGFLVMLPTTNLYKTWINEIEKHMDTFNIVTQNANGSLSKHGSKKKNVVIGANTVVITTMGRCRDHPLNNQWILTVVDECLTVQNKDSLQTERAYVEALRSQYGILMLSASFFRSRFDKLFYMLKMLRTGLPGNIEYLDTILNECIVCNITDTERKWIVNFHKIKMEKRKYEQYKEIIDNNKNKDAETLFVLLSKFIHDNVDYSKLLDNIVSSMDADRRCLIYCKSKKEADKLSEIGNDNENDNDNDITRYPDISGKHTCLSYEEGTYGLNDLIFCDTIITRIPAPDKLPQMKGRLDRYGQKNDVLYMEYVLLENTIEEGGLMRLEIANNFHNNYIMPLGEFYKLSTGH